MTKGGKLIEEIFEGATINTPSLLCVEDAIDALKWMESVGGLEAIIARSKANLEAITKWVEKTPVDRLPGRGPKGPLFDLGLLQGCGSVVWLAG